MIPLLLLFIFGYGINLDSSKLRVGILLEQRSEAALDFTTMTGSPYIDATISDNRQELIAKMQAGKIRGLVVIPVDFAEQMERANATAPIQVITDGSEPNTAATLYRVCRRDCRSGKCSERRTTGRLLNRLLMYKPATGLTRRRLASTSLSPCGDHHHDGHRRDSTSLVVAREWERGTMEALLSTEITRTELLLCKLIPYYFLGCWRCCCVCWCQCLFSACRIAVRC